MPFGLLFPFGWAALLHPYEQYMRRGSRGGQSLACWFPVTDGFTIPEVTSKQLVENGSHGIKIAKTGDFWRFSALFAGPAVSLGAIDPGFRAFAGFRCQLPQLLRRIFYRAFVWPRHNWLTCWYRTLI